MHDGVALLLINADTSAHRFSVPTARFPLTGGGVNVTSASLHVRDLWARAPLHSLPKGSAAIEVMVGGLDSAFLRLTPATLVEVEKEA